MKPRFARSAAPLRRSRRASTLGFLLTLIAATVRHAITLDATEAARFLALFKRMLPKNLSALEI